MVLVCLCGAGQVSAQGCPDFFRFVDFGLEDRNGVFSRGGPLLRAESLGGTPLLLRDQTTCREVRDIASDGHGNPIPVVTGVSYDPARVQLGLSALHVRFAADTGESTQAAVRTHQDRLARADVRVIRGERFLCAQAGSVDQISCQLVSPYPGNRALVVYCEDGACSLPALAMNDRMQISANWERTAQDPEKVAAQMMRMVAGIHAFLEPLM